MHTSRYQGCDLSLSSHSPTANQGLLYSMPPILYMKSLSMRYRMYYITVLLQLYYVITLCAKPIHNDYYEYTFWVVRLNYSSYTFFTGLAAGFTWL